MHTPETTSSPVATVVQKAWRRFCRFVTWVFYRRFEVAGLGHLPASGPVILCANHVNALADGLVVQASCPRPLHPLARSGLFRHPLLRPVLGTLQAVPIYRRHPGRDAAAANEASFERCYDFLEEGRVLLIFPEGQSHSDPMLRPLKTGAARIALGLLRRHGRLPALVPVGLTFPGKGRFRSEALVQYGDPVEVGEGPPGETGEEAVARVTAAILRGLEDVTLNVDSWQDLKLLRLLDRFFTFRRGRRKRSLADRFRSLKRLVDAHRLLRLTRPDEVGLLAAKLERFERLRRRYGVEDYHLHLRYTPGVVARFLGRSLLFAAVVFPLALWGFLNSALPYTATRTMSRRTARGRDQYDSAGMFFGLFFFLVFWSAQGFAVFWWWGKTAAALYLASIVVTALVALRVGHERRRIVENVRVFLTFLRKKELRRYLFLKRQELEVDLAQMARKARRPRDLA